MKEFISLEYYTLDLGKNEQDEISSYLNDGWRIVSSGVIHSNADFSEFKHWFHLTR